CHPRPIRNEPGDITDGLASYASGSSVSGGTCMEKMTSVAGTLLVGLLTAAPLLAQFESAAQLPRPARLVSFDPQTVELNNIQGQWALTAGEVVLKDLGQRGIEARQCWQLVRQLGLTEHGSLGGSRELMEYWLIGGQAPHWLPHEIRSMPIDL